MSEKILSASPSEGIGYLHDYYFDEVFDDMHAQMTKAQPRLPRLQKRLELARFCEQQQQLAHAVDLYRDVLICGGITSLQQHKRSAEAALARQAYKALVRLSESDDEYVWEMCSQTVGDLHYLFDKASDN